MANPWRPCGRQLFGVSVLHDTKPVREWLHDFRFALVHLRTLSMLNSRSDTISQFAFSLIFLDHLFPTVGPNGSYRLEQTVPEYLYGVVLQRNGLSPPENAFGHLKFQLTFNLAVVWMIVFVSLSKGKTKIIIHHTFITPSSF